MGPEVKRVDINTIQQPFLSTGSPIQLINGIGQGDNSWERNGMKIQLKSIEFDMQVFATPPVASTNYASEVILFALVYDRQNNLTTPIQSTIFESVNNAGLTTSNADAYPNFNFKSRFLILALERWNMPKVQSGLSTAAPFQLEDEFDPNQAPLTMRRYIKLKNLPTIYNGIGSLFGSIASGALFFVTLSTTTQGVWSADFSCRLTFTDI